MKTTAPSPETFLQINDNLLSGDWKIPSFQREYVWTEKQGGEFLDSIYKGYPTGLIYVWEPAENEALVNDDSLNTELKSQYLIDGQQRVTTLYKLWNEKDDYDLYFNPTTEQFQKLSQKNFYSFTGSKKFKSFDNKLVSVRQVIEEFPSKINDIKEFWEKQETERVLQPNSGGQYLSTDEKNSILKLKRTLEGISLSVISIRDASAEEILNLFTRINTAGVKLDWVEAIAAPLLLNIKPSLKKDIYTFLKNEKDLFKNFENTLSIDFFLSGIVRLIEPNFNATITDKSLNKDLYKPETIERAFDILKTGTKFSIEFLNNSLKIKSEKSIKKNFSFLMLSIITGLLNNKLPDDKSNLVKAFFTLTNVFDFYSSSTSITNKKEHFDAFKGFVKDALDKKSVSSTDVLNELEKVVDSLVTATKKINGDFFNEKVLTEAKYSNGKTTSPFVMLEYYLLQNNATTFKGTHSSIDFSNAHKHHIYPVNFLEKKNIDSKAVNSIGNITYIDGDKNIEYSDKSPVDYFKEHKPVNGTLEKHLFPQTNVHDKNFTDYNQLTSDNFQLFVSGRLSLLEKEFNTYLNSLVK